MTGRAKLCQRLPQPGWIQSFVRCRNGDGACDTTSAWEFNGSMLSGRLYRAESHAPYPILPDPPDKADDFQQMGSRYLVRYVLLVNMFGLVAALAIDVTQQLLFFTTWAAALRSWAVTIAAVTVIATPVATMFARAQWELQHAKDALEELSRTDPLTGMPNRRALMEASEAPTPQTMVLVIADVDRFKAVNDTAAFKPSDGS